MTGQAVRAGVPGSVAVGTAQLAGRRVVLARSRDGACGGSLDEAGATNLEAAATLAHRLRRPLVLVLASTGADLDDGVGALDGWGRAAAAIAACAGVVPVLAAITGPAVGGSALLLGMADVVVATEAAAAYVSGPAAIAAFTGEVLDGEELGGPASLRRTSGVVAHVATDEAGALDFLGAVLAHLPDSCDDEPPTIPTDDPVERATPELTALIPAASTGSYDVRLVAAALADEGEVLELWAGWAPNLVTALATVDGRPLGIVANQPIALAGTLDIPSSQKGARFVALCDAFNLPILTLVDTSGFLPGKDLEWRGIIRHGAQLVSAYARATVPRVCLVLRKAYGGAYIVMDSKTMGNDVCLAWPSAELAVMGAKGAVEILHRRSTPEARAEAEADYEATLLTPWVAAEHGLVDAVVDPADTRRSVAGALAMLRSKRERLPGRSHDNTPL
ncbi:MAG: acyl-CoA carboxylase subunit beta [Acidimicrobiia bacterium]